MALIYAQVNLPHTSGLPGDVCVNTFSFDDTIADGTTIATALVNFYNVAGAGGGAALCTYLSQDLSRTALAASIRLYTPNIATGAVGLPFLVVPWTLGATIHTQRLPEEVALCLSFHGLDQADPRQRGRIYFGPLNQSTQSALGGGALASAPSSDVINDLGRRGDELKDVAGIDWAVWSRADAALYQVVGGWVDNAFDTMRSRGEKATARTIWS